MSLLTLIYIVTPIASIIIALLLIHWAKLSEEARLREEDARRNKGLLVPGFVDDEFIKQAVFKQVS
ncbi:MAG: hypothetical protein KKC39_01910 [Candidatus Omnitrophica bacterium]|nr:hypothetical protein [Candidatus Omnitrophota bacterium]MBU4303744.1 hypothetical protein [Candidatus Omnitrophota bacterium]MBU4467488.1 hypothetical protein [Candidatus Omnitrophota bacterium]MCG2707567.1 hypothetical protein [Candidatus Omnitrophota bacterium]